MPQVDQNRKPLLDRLKQTPLNALGRGVAETEGLGPGDYEDRERLGEHRVSQTFRRIKRFLLWCGAGALVGISAAFLLLVAWLAWLHFSEVAKDPVLVKEFLGELVMGVLLVLATLFVDRVFRKK